ncbi:PIR Superfamily Protein [Plasmodium malariae]|uniref:PIR Superfamily Protein n=1 Tax=Plasmodium malariae TaxID=5858 RepID=A0A1A8XBE3_PLAMA|nr:PIR Superfamily Protein [Plasmodium malariae]
MLSLLREFRNIESEVKQKTSSLINEDDKDTFRNGCIHLASYLIKNNNPPQYYRDHQKSWKGTLNYRLNRYYKGLGNHGGCPLILEEKDKKILELKYEEDDFCEKKKKDLHEIKQLGRDSKNYSRYLRKCNEYNSWIEKMQNHFNTKKSFFQKCYQKNEPKGKRKKTPDMLCDLINEKTFQKLTECTPSLTLIPVQPLSSNGEIESQMETEVTAVDLPKSHVNLEQQQKHQPHKTSKDEQSYQYVMKTKEEQEFHPSLKPESNLQILSSDPSDIGNEENWPKSMHAETSDLPKNSDSHTLVKLGEPESTYLDHESIKSSTVPGSPSPLTRELGILQYFGFFVLYLL